LGCIRILEDWSSKEEEEEEEEGRKHDMIRM
jgi:hypothetical protein